MLFYPTKKTCDVYSITPTTEEKILANTELAKLHDELKNDLYKWGMKLFYIDGKKCLQLMNYKTKMTIIFLDIPKKMLFTMSIPLLERYLRAIYASDSDMQKCLDMYFQENTMFSYLKLDNRSVIGSLNENEYQFEWLRDVVYSSISNGIVDTNLVNCQFSDSVILTVNKKYVYCKEEFRERMVESFLKE